MKSKAFFRVFEGLSFGGEKKIKKIKKITETSFKCNWLIILPRVFKVHY